jgi:hypothetical protein
MLDSHVVEAFPLVAHVTDLCVRVPVRPAIGGALPWRARRYLALVGGPAQGRLLRHFSPGVVHQHFATWSRAAVSTAAELHVPAIVTLHGYDVFEAIAPRGSLLGGVHAASRRPDRVRVAPSP